MNNTMAMKHSSSIKSFDTTQNSLSRNHILQLIGNKKETIVLYIILLQEECTKKCKLVKDECDESSLTSVITLYININPSSLYYFFSPDGWSNFLYFRRFPSSVRKPVLVA